MMWFYNWFICKVFKKCQIEIIETPTAAFKRYCEENSSSKSCRIYDL
jgi:hypothetical protein